MTVYWVISVLNMPYLHRIYVWFWPLYMATIYDRTLGESRAISALYVNGSTTAVPSTFIGHLVVGPLEANAKANAKQW